MRSCIRATRRLCAATIRIVASGSVLLAAIGLAVVAQPEAAFAVVPHTVFTNSTKACQVCHRLHQAAGPNLVATSSVGDPLSTGACYVCHDGTAALTNVKTAPLNSFALASGHALEGVAGTTVTPDLTDGCSSCHSPHRRYGIDLRLPRASIVTSSGTYAVTASNDNSWCFACHNDANDWFTSTTSTPYPASSAPIRGIDLYPLYGTFPGRSVYASASANLHSAIPTGSVPDPIIATATVVRGRGDCLWCHAGHRGVSRYDSLLATFAAPTTDTVVQDRTNGDYAASCFTCHGGGSWEASGATNIKRYATKAPDDTSATSGHRIKTGGAALPVNAPLPCYECHNPHGSARGNKMLLADTLGRSLESSTSGGVVITAGADVRKLCFCCHSTSDTTPRVWDATASAYVTCTPDMMFYGLRRDGTLLPSQTKPAGYSLNQNYLRLKPIGGNHHGMSSTKSCYDCHGGSYVATGTANVHAPTMGVSNGRMACYGCHAEYQPMEDNIGSVTGGASRLSYYHHVLGSSTYDGDYAPATSTAYPTSATDVYCVSCHTDHDLFNSNKGANLRTTIGAASATATNTDFIAPGTAGAPGICVSCHSVQRTKQNADQKVSVTTPTTYTVSVDATGYAASAHTYSVVSTFGTSPFRADCAKCHNDTMTKSYQDASGPLGTLATFGVHLSSEARILAALGGTIADPYEEGFCYKCHSRVVDGQGATWTASYQFDRYGRASMSATSVAVYQQMQRTYGHKVQNYSGKHKASPSDETTGYIGQSTSKHIECADCHNPHGAKKGARTVGGTTGNVAGPALAGAWGYALNWSGLSLWTTPTAARYSLVTSVTYEYQVCFKCHTTGTNAALSSWGGAGADAWTDVALEFNPANRSYHPVLAVTTGNSAYSTGGWMKSPWTNVGAQTMTCSDCHGDFSAAAAGPHGSSIRRILKGYWPLNASGTAYTLNNADNDLLCRRCHNVQASTVGPTVHIRGNSAHRSTPCYRCHIVIPHGGGLQGFIGDSNGQMPARYAYGANKTNLVFTGYTGGDGNTRTNCYVVSGCQPSSHGGSTPPANGEW